MAEIKALAAIREKYARVTPARSEDYAAGIEAPKRDWSAATAAAEGAYDEGVQAAVSRGAFKKGVTAAGTDKWKKKAASVGVDRWGPGVRAGVDAYEAGYGEYRAVIEGVKLPPAYPRGDPRNYARVQAIGEALHKKRIGGK